MPAFPTYKQLLLLCVKTFFDLLILKEKIKLFNVQIVDIEKRWISSLPLPTPTIIETYIEDASVLIEIHYPNIHERLQTERGLDKRIKIAVSQMVIRALQNPDKIRQQQETAGSFSGGVTYGKETLTGLEITEAEKRLLAPTNIPRNNKMFTIQPENFYND